MSSLFVCVALAIIFASLQCLQTEAKAVPELERLRLLNFSVDASNLLSCPSTWFDDGTVTVNESGTLVVSGTPNVGGTAVPCKINFKRPTADICQVRVDFVSFTMTGPNDSGDCDRASLSVTADNLQDFVACGDNTGQHLYLNYGDCDIVSININPNFDNSPAPAFHILTRFVSCDSSGNSVESDPAPVGCDQYYTASGGQVRSFNYVSSVNDMQSQINNEKYTVCIKTPAAARRISWTVCRGETDSFDKTGFDSPSQDGSSCQTDWVDIPGSPNGRYCGGNFPTTVISAVRPFQMFVNFNEEEIPGKNGIINPVTGCNVGFFCQNQYGIPITAPAVAPDVLPCDSPEANAAGQSCVLDPGLMPLVDSDNKGFCLQYALTN